MRTFKVQIVISFIFLGALTLSILKPATKVEAIYASQVLMLLLSLIFSRRQLLYCSSIISLLFADLIYYLLVYKYQFGTDSKEVVLYSSFLYGASFLLFAFVLLKDNLATFYKIISNTSEKIVLLLFILIGCYFILIPGLNCLFLSGFAFARISNFITILSSLPLVCVTYIFLTNGNDLGNKTVITGYFVLGILDIGLQLETIKYGDLKFSLYDFLWFFGVYLISVSTIKFDVNRLSLLQGNSIVNLVNKLFFVAALIPTFIFFLVTQGTFQLSPMYFIFLVISFFLFGILLSQLLSHRLNQYNQIMEEIIASNKQTELETVINKIPHEFGSTLYAVYNGILERKLDELDLEKEKIQNDLLIYRRMAHDIASPLSVLEVITKTNGEFDEERKSLLNLATQRVRNIANDIMYRQRSSTELLIHNYCSITSNEIVTVIEEIISEKRVEYLEIGSSIILDLVKSNLEDFSFIGEPNELARILSNVINNSKEAILAKSDGKIAISVHCNDSEFIIRIVDNGKGFDEMIVKNNFRTPISLKRGRGHGIGLFSAVKILARWKAKFQLSNELIGASVTIKLKSVEQIVDNNNATELYFT